jgi:conjugative relaxase-like TrwC/TraI family protein
MLSIGKLGGNKADYYLQKVARGIEDYYTGAGEAPGSWTGDAADEIDLFGQVEGELLHRALAGKHPKTGGELARPPRGAIRVPGYDLTFSAPKSASLLFALGDSDVRREVRDAHDAAVEAALGYMQRQAAVGRRGRGGTVAVIGNGFLAAAFRHRTSRAGDPQLHTHVLVANMTRGPDGRWTALDARKLYAHAKTGGYLYQAHLRAELTRRIGVRWTQVHNGQAEIVGFSAPVLRAFSRRRAELEARMQERAEHSARAAQTAALDTRRSKDYAVDGATLADRWRSRAAQLGLQPENLTQLLGRAEPRPLDDRHARHVNRRLGGPEGLTHHQSNFSRRDVLRAWSEQLRQGGAVELVERLADDFLASERAVALAQGRQSLARSDVIRRADGRVVPTVLEERIYSTPELLQLEGSTIERARAGGDAKLGVVDAHVVDAAIRRRATMTQEQGAMVRALCRDGRAVHVVVGKAGTGKTFAMDTARAAWEAEGYRVIGAALARRAARQLQDEAGIESTSIAALLADLRAGQPGTLLGHGQTVLVLDETGMVGTRQLAEIIDHAAHAQMKLILLGDPHQLPEIHAGGVFRGLTLRSDPIQLTENRRQREGWQREALDLLRDGSAGEALSRYDEKGRIVTCDCAGEVRQRMVADWWQARERGEQAMMIALRREDVRDLNGRARALMTAAGRLGEDSIELDGREFAVGDEVVALRNAPRLGVLNGTHATITAVLPGERAIQVRTTDARDVVLPASYLDPPAARSVPSLDHGYAITGHKAQGLTADTALVLGTEDLYREWGYVALGRGRAHNRLYLTVPSPSERDEYSPAGDQRDPLDVVTRALQRSRAQTMASDARTRDLAAGAADERVSSADPPEYLLAALGPAPELLSARRRWQDTASAIGSYRERYAIDDRDRALGGRPDELRQRAEWRGLRHEIERVRRERDTPERIHDRAIER